MVVGVGGENIDENGIKKMLLRKRSVKKVPRQRMRFLMKKEYSSFLIYHGIAIEKYFATLRCNNLNWEKFSLPLHSSSCKHHSQTGGIVGKSFLPRKLEIPLPLEVTG